MIGIVVAMAKNGAIGKDNQLLWHITEDLKHFKSLTSGATVVMGRKTYDSIGKPLPNRRNIVVSRSISLVDGAEVYGSLEDALAVVQRDERVFVIGGGEIYRQALGMADMLYLTLVDKEYEADTFFPSINYDEWEVVEKEDFFRGVKYEFPFSFVTYKRKVN